MAYVQDYTRKFLGIARGDEMDKWVICKAFPDGGSISGDHRHVTGNSIEHLMGNDALCLCRCPKDTEAEV